MSKPAQPCMEPDYSPKSSTLAEFEFKKKEIVLDSLPNHFPFFVEKKVRYRVYYVEFRANAPPPSDLGHSGDVWIDMTPGSQALYGRNTVEWVQWQGLCEEIEKRLVHPHLPDRYLWCSTRSFVWYMTATISRFWGAKTLDEARRTWGFEDRSQLKDTSRVIESVLKAEKERVQNTPTTADSRNEAPATPIVNESDSLSKNASPRKPQRTPREVPRAVNTASEPLPRIPKIRIPARAKMDPPVIKQAPEELDILRAYVSTGVVTDAGDRLEDSNRKLREENRSLREQIAELSRENILKATIPSMKSDMFRDIVRAAVGEEYFSEELAVIASVAIVNNLTKGIGMLRTKLRAAEIARKVSDRRLSECQAELKKVIRRELSRGQSKGNSPFDGRSGPSNRPNGIVPLPRSWPPPSGESLVVYEPWGLAPTPPEVCAPPFTAPLLPDPPAAQVTPPSPGSEGSLELDLEYPSTNGTSGHLIAANWPEQIQAEPGTNGGEELAGRTKRLRQEEEEEEEEPPQKRTPPP